MALDHLGHGVICNPCNLSALGRLGHLLQTRAGQGDELAVVGKLVHDPGSDVQVMQLGHMSNSATQRTKICPQGFHSVVHRLGQHVRKDIDLHLVRH